MEFRFISCVEGEAETTTEPIWNVVAEGGEGREGTHEDMEWKVFEMNRGT